MHSRIFVKNVYGLILALPFAMLASGINLALPIQQVDKNQIHLDQFDVLSATTGWVLLDGHLFRTSDAGQSWNEISPSIPVDAVVQDVEFIDPDTGWVLLTAPNPDGGALFQLAHTTDGGVTWTTRALSLFESGEVASYAEKAETGWFDTQTGWISVKQTSGSNFSIGTLFITSDGGNTWSRSTLPIADKIVFNEPQTGWAIGGPTGEQIFKTQDAGGTWENVRPDDIPENIQATAYPPFVSGGQGLLVTTSLGSENSLNVYAFENFSGKWLPAGQVTLDVQTGVIGLSILDAQNFVATIPGTKSIVRMMDGELDVLDNQDGLSASIVQLDMVSLDIGWAKSVDSSCITASSLNDQTASVTCSSTTRFLHTTDGGITWQSLILPSVQPDTAPPRTFSSNRVMTMNSLSNLGNTQVLIGQGFDKCEIPTLSQMQTWSGNSPYKAVNLYIGGSSRACYNTALTSAYLKQLYQQGWKFIPTWVGPQAPCTGFLTRMSNDVTTAYGQGVNEANLAVERLAELGLTYPDKTGSVVYYDIEHYGTNTACRNAVNAFMNGWVSQIHSLGNMAGVYGSTLCNTGLSDFLNITNVPDVIWPARWYHNPGSGSYDPNASVWDLGSCVTNTVWANHQRIRQYEGGHDETWGSLTLEIDNNVLDGVVAIPYIAPLVKSITRMNSNPTSAASVGFTVKISETVTGVDSSDFDLTTTGVTGGSISAVSGSGDTYAVTVNTGSGNGTIQLDVIDNDSIRNVSNNPLGGTGIGNGNFNSGDVYTVSKPLVDVYIGGNVMGSYSIPSNPSLFKSYSSTVDGPVKVTSTNGMPVLTSQRAFYGNSFNELMGYPADQFTTEYWFPWYDNVYMQTWILVGNPSTTDTAEVEIYIDGEMKASSSIPPNGRVTPMFAGLINGPVRVVCTNCASYGGTIFASERSLYGDSFSEVMGYPADQFTTEYWFPWYDNVYMQTWILVGNPSASQTAYVDIFIGGTKQDSYIISPNGRITPQFTGQLNGPVQVVSTTGVGTPTALPIFASERSLYGTSFNEVMGYPKNQFTTDYSFPWYDNTGSMQSWILVGNPSASQTAYVEIYIGGALQLSTSIAPNGRITPTFPANTGPVRVVSTTGAGTPSPIDIFTSERSLYLTSFNEVMGYAADQLTTEYWFTWYDNVFMNTDILISKP